jgi:hypothetical protein
MFHIYILYVLDERRKCKGDIYLLEILIKQMYFGKSIACQMMNTNTHCTIKEYLITVFYVAILLWVRQKGLNTLVQNEATYLLKLIRSNLPILTEDPVENVNRAYYLNQDKLLNTLEVNVFCMAYLILNKYFSTNKH